MIEDEQILLQNLSSDLIPLPLRGINTSVPKIQAEPFILQQYLGESEAVMVGVKSPRKFYVDWSKADNHHYFTKDVEEDEDPLAHTNHIHPPHDYSQLSMKLEIALALIKKQNSARSLEGKCLEKRSQSNEPRRESEMRAMTKTAGNFKAGAVKQRKQSIQLRFKTEVEQEQRPNNNPPGRMNNNPPGRPNNPPGRMNRMEKYQAIAEQATGKQSYKENTLRTKFLQSMAQWQEKKQRRIQQRIERELRLTMEGVTFTPEINPRSRQIMKKKGNIAPIYEREHREKKRELTERFNVEQKAHRMKL